MWCNLGRVCWGPWDSGWEWWFAQMLHLGRGEEVGRCGARFTRPPARRAASITAIGDVIGPLFSQQAGTPANPSGSQRTDVDHWWHGWQMGDRGWTAACSCRPTTAASSPHSTPSRVLGPLAVVSAGESPVQFGRTGPGFQPPAPNGRVAFTAPHMRGTPGAKRSSSTGTPDLLTVTAAVENTQAAGGDW